MTNKLTNYIFIDQERLDIFVQQFSHSFISDLAWKAGISLAGPTFEVTNRESINTKANHKKIQSLIRYLHRNKLLSDHRPDYTQADFTKPNMGIKLFAMETMLARRTMVPSDYLKELRGLQSFSVWISDPTEVQQSSDESLSISAGAFLYLTEMHWDNGSFATPFALSGCSALQAIANMAQGRDLLDFPDTNGAYEPLGRGSAAHPITKLERLGAIADKPRRITALYIIRHATNEQVFTSNDQEYRVSDILGYPIFISAE